MEFFGSVTRIFGACVPSVAPCAAAAAAAAARTHPAAVRVSEQSNGFDWFSRRRRSTRRLSEAAPVPSSSPVPAPWESRVSSVPFHHRTIPITKPPPPPPPPPIFSNRGTWWTKGRSSVVLSTRSCDRDIYIQAEISKRRFINGAIDR